MKQSWSTICWEILFIEKSVFILKKNKQKDRLNQNFLGRFHDFAICCIVSIELKSAQKCVKVGETLLIV